MGMFLSMADLGQTSGDPAAMEAQAAALDQAAAQYRSSNNPAMIPQAAALESQAQSIRLAATALRAQQAKEAADSAATQGAVIDLVGKILNAGAAVGGAVLLSERQRKAQKDALRAQLAANQNQLAANQNQPQTPQPVQSGMSTTTAVLLGLGGVAVVGTVLAVVLSKKS